MPTCFLLPSSHPALLKPPEMLPGDVLTWTPRSVAWGRGCSTSPATHWGCDPGDTGPELSFSVPKMEKAMPPCPSWVGSNHSPFEGMPSLERCWANEKPQSQLLTGDPWVKSRPQTYFEAHRRYENLELHANIF